MNGMRDLYFFLETRTLRFSKNYVCRLSAIWNRSVREDASERYELKNYSCLHTMISREPEVVLRRMKNRFKGQGSASNEFSFVDRKLLSSELQRFKLFGISIRILIEFKRLKNYSCLHTTISREPEVVSRRMKNRFKGQGSTFLTIFYSLTGSCYLRSYNGLNFSKFQ